MLQKQQHWTSSTTQQQSQLVLHDRTQQHHPSLQEQLLQQLANMLGSRARPLLHLQAASGLTAAMDAW
jgi:hypothetical protein